ncbi:MAG: sigma 54-interacting transcriptional regulator [Deltaproteobacteria bacterium]|nr:sigma 54-interacting transcriptional regulator [Deltaproteobacteria bacterium]
MVLESKGWKRNVLVVDSSSSVRTSLWMILKDEYAVLTAKDQKEALEMVERQEVDLALVGIDFPIGYYQGFLRSLRKVRPGLSLLFLLGESGAGEKKFDLPFSDSLSKPFGVEPLRQKIKALLMQKECVEKGRGLRVPFGGEERIKTWLYSSRLSPEVRERVFRVAGSLLPVLLQGEEGTGRSGVAKAIHYLHPYKDRLFLRFFCRELTPEGLMQKLSFWLKNKASGGSVSLTLFLEEVDSLGWDLQGILLDLLHDGGVGWPGLEEMAIEARVISSSRVPLARAVSAGKFRGDLCEALEVLRIGLKPLRERREEIPCLVSEILQEQGQEGIFRKKFSSEALQVLQEYCWPGNLRELESLVLRSAILKEGDLLLPEDLVFSFSDVGTGLAEGKREEGVPPVSPAIGEEAVGEKESLFDETLSTLAHEIKNPLVAISTFAYLLPEKYEDAEFREQFSRLVNLDVKRLNELLENLLEYAQFSAPRLIRNDLNLAVVAALRQREESLLQRGVRWETDLKEGLPEILFDESHLGFVLRSILGNVFSKIRENRSLRLSTGFVAKGSGGDGKDFVELLVWYEGQDGVIRDLHGDVGSEAGLEFENLSLALALARKVMVRNHGEMQVNQGQGTGTTICLRFPVAG